jgi:hypothetical protein
MARQTNRRKRKLGEMVRGSGSVKGRMNVRKDKTLTWA